jgi:hypothetical protein
VLDIVAHQNIRVSDVIVSDILGSDHLTIVFHILDHVKIRNLSEPVEKFTDWERFQSLALERVSPRVEINSGVEADKEARDSTPLLLRHIGCRQVKSHFRIQTTIYRDWIVC